MQTNWINGQSVASASPMSLAVINPAIETQIDTIPQGCAEDVQRAVSAARDAQVGWSNLSPTQRKSQLRLIASKLDACRREIAELLTAENGKPIGEALGEVSAAVDMAYSYSELAVHLRSGNQGAMRSELSFQHREARGVVACIVPWNYPLSTAFGNLLPAVATGNSVVWKPSEKTPLSSRFLVERVFDHLPPGVVNLILGDGTHAGEALVRNRGVDAVAFIGSVRVGRRIGEICGHDLKKVILELGGKDRLSSMKQSMWGKLRNLPHRLLMQMPVRSARRSSASMCSKASIQTSARRLSVNQKPSALAKVMNRRFKWDLLSMQCSSKRCRGK